MTVVEEGDDALPDKKGGCGVGIDTGVSSPPPLPLPPEEEVVAGYMLGENVFSRGGISRWRFI